MNLHHSDFIAILASIYKPTVYVELGLCQGLTLSKVQPYIGKGYGVDMKSNISLETLKQKYSNLEIICSTTNEFFEKFNEGIDMAFIDADHCYDSAIILLHDTDPESNKFIDPGYCGDSYKMVKYLENHPDINCTTLPLTEAGLTMVTKKNDTRTFRRGIQP